jgi:hypothetical protein
MKFPDWVYKKTSLEQFFQELRNIYVSRNIRSVSGKWMILKLDRKVHVNIGS